MTAHSGFAAKNPVPPTFDWAAQLKDAALAAFVATLLGLPMVGLETYDIGGGALGIRTHFNWVAVAAAAVFTGRLGMHLCRRLYRGRERHGPGVLVGLVAWTSRRATPITLAGIAFAVALPFLPFS